MDAEPLACAPSGVTWIHRQAAATIYCEGDTTEIKARRNAEKMQLLNRVPRGAFVEA
jgi:hypothetical protein